MPDGHRCEPVVDADGTVWGHALVSADLPDEGRAALVNMVQAARQWMAELDAADPEAAEERARRQAAAIARVRERMRRYRDGAE